jgi:putative tryptophan/tyrosine transport system substrate-binding protein
MSAFGGKADIGPRSAVMYKNPFIDVVGCNAGSEGQFMNRREFITLACGVTVMWPHSANAQQPTAPVIGILNAGSMATNTQNLQSFLGGMRELGYEDGRNIKFEYRFAENDLDRLPMLAAELVDLNPRVIVSSPMPANLAAKRATRTIPVVMATGADPVGFGLVASLNRPGGNVTGLANFAELLASKQIDFLRELMPRTLARWHLDQPK